MKTEEKVKNIFAFLSILFGEKYECLKEIMDMPPDYIIEKFERYVLSDYPEADWGLHPTIKKDVFDRYCVKYELPVSDWVLRTRPFVKDQGKIEE